MLNGIQRLLITQIAALQALCQLQQLLKAMQRIPPWQQILELWQKLITSSMAGIPLQTGLAPVMRQGQRISHRPAIQLFTLNGKPSLLTTEIQITVVRRLQQLMQLLHQFLYQETVAL